jgi:hypothetical protein
MTNREQDDGGDERLDDGNDDPTSWELVKSARGIEAAKVPSFLPAVVLCRSTDLRFSVRDGGNASGWSREKRGRPSLADG